MMGAWRTLDDPVEGLDIEDRSFDRRSNPPKRLFQSESDMVSERKDELYPFIT
jgi:hypothetical protein